ncbi:MAG TPA: phosphatidylserine/phosphatidylglycerophosphate/cardiolipin synthase family protein [Gemmatimonadales bacterium]|nr:phosphatidylserine/phosphatidylglycerophosphate/cardiolipin synthase family protein [Gemmatimonadales bacterium]
MLFLLLSLVGCSSPAYAGPPAAGAVSPPGGDVRLWQDAAILTLVGGLIGSARRRLLVEMYELGRQDVVDGLGRARAGGVTVTVITDPTVDVSRHSSARLRALGVEARAYPVDDARHQIDHVKLLIADGVAVVGGMNWGTHSDRNHDYVLETHVSADVGRLARIFEQDWELAGGRPSPLGAETGAVAQTAPGSEIRSMLEGVLRHASRRVLAEVYTLTDARVIAELVAAHRRGADVRLVLDPNQVYNLHAAAMLRAGGVPVRWYPVPIGVLLHAKIGLFDGELVLGSANWTVSGLGVNHELDIETADAGAVGAYLSRFESDWTRSAA